MKAINVIFFIFFFILSSISCKEKVNESLQILIQNKTDSLIFITLFPKLISGSLYPSCEGCGGFKENKFTLSPNYEKRYEWKEVIYTSTIDMDIEPYDLAVNVFDSIYISFTNKDTVNLIIKFTNETVIGYKENLFKEDATWDFFIEERTDEPGFKDINYCYSFFIVEEKIIIN